MHVRSKHLWYSYNCWQTRKGYEVMLQSNAIVPTECRLSVAVVKLMLQN